MPRQFTCKPSLDQGLTLYFLSCRPRDFGRAKYELVTSLRTHLGCQDDAFGCMGVAEDAEGLKGVFLRKNVIEVAGRALKTNITALAPRVLPWSQLVRQLLFVYPWMLCLSSWFREQEMPISCSLSFSSLSLVFWACIALSGSLHTKCFSGSGHPLLSVLQISKMRYSITCRNSLAGSGLPSSLMQSMRPCKGCAC